MPTKNTAEPSNRNYNPQPRYFNIGYEPIVGCGCSLVNTLFDCAEQITIGDCVLFGHDCMVLTGSHDYYQYGMDRLLAQQHKPVKIGDGAWIASRAIILPGVSIGENAVIGAGSVVTQNVPPYQVWHGVPAKYSKTIVHDCEHIPIKGRCMSCGVRL